MNEPEGTKSSYRSKSIFPLKIWRKGKKFVNLQAKKNIREMSAIRNTTSSSYMSPYWGLLKNLSDREKLGLISLLSSSIVSKGRKRRTSANWASRFAGVWKDERTADEIVEDIRSCRTSNNFDVEL